MINGAHTVIFSKDPQTDRAFLRDVCKFPFVDAGEGWLIFSLPPTEIAIHPGNENNKHEIYFTCDDINQFSTQMTEHNIDSSPVQDVGWGLLIYITLPGGGKLGVYQPKHKRP